MLTDQAEQAEKRRTLLNDARVREQQQQASSLLDHARAAADDLSGGRFAGVNPATVVGSTPVPKYPAAAAHQFDPCGTEPPLGVRIDAMPGDESSTLLAVVEATGGPADAPFGGSGPACPSGGLMSERAGSPSSAIGGELTPQETFPACGSAATVGPSPTTPKPGNDNNG
jgi:hypothetical protein